MRNRQSVAISLSKYRTNLQNKLFLYYLQIDTGFSLKSGVSGTAGILGEMAHDSCVICHNLGSFDRCNKDSIPF